MNVCGEKPLTLLQLSIKILYHYEATSYSHQNSYLLPTLPNAVISACLSLALSWVYLPLVFKDSKSNKS